MRSLDLALFGLGTLVGVVLTPVRGLCRTLAHAAWHPGCTH